jgi:formate dehydrogenase major subunit
VSPRVDLTVHATEQVERGQLFAAFHLPDAPVNVLTWDWSDEVTSCPEYKVTAVSVAPSLQ